MPKGGFICSTVSCAKCGKACRFLDGKHARYAVSNWPKLEVGISKVKRKGGRIVGCKLNEISIVGLKHRHDRTSWLLMGGRLEWCFVCGAFRHLGISEKPRYSYPIKGREGRWRKPSGNPKVNPARFLS
jgi:hypothetical protein